MNIQIISTSESLKASSEDVTYSLIKSPKSLDEFDINVIDLSSEYLWRNRGSSTSSINQINDFYSISSMISRKKLSKILIVLPCNVNFLYNYTGYNKKYEWGKPLKDMLKSLHSILTSLLPEDMLWPDIEFENTRTTLNSFTYTADFYFDDTSNVIALSDRSEKTIVVGIKLDSVYATTLNIFQSTEMLFGFLNHIFPNSTKEDAPDWIKDFSFADDKEQLEAVSRCKEKIDIANAEIKKAEAKLGKNLQYKSILYTNGSELVQVVYEILGKILSYDLSDFVDKRKEDFLVVKDQYTLIGEIKGVTSNVKNEHVSQVEVHYQSYMDKLAEEGKTENVHQILIINPFRTKPLNERDPVHEQQIKLAERNGCLIIETITLLKIFERFLSDQISSQQCIDIFLGSPGLLTEEIFYIEDNDLESYKV